MKRPRFALTSHSLVGLLAALCLACTDSQVHPLAPQATGGGGAPDVEQTFHPYGVDGDRGPGTCWNGASRDFAFWIGRWDVTERGPTPLGTNEIRRALGGCLLTENYVGPDGIRGLSYSAYDHPTGAWLQTYVSEFDATNYRLTGTASDGTVVMEGPRLFRLPSGNLFPVVDRVTWSDLGSGGARHLVELSTDGGASFPFVISDLTYTHASPYRPADLVGSDACTATEFRALDTWIGNWTVRVGDQVVGRATVRKVLSGCALEERYQAQGARGYKAWSLVSYDPTTQTWHRTYVDNTGAAFRLEQGAGPDIALVGARPDASGVSVPVVNTFETNGDAPRQSFRVGDGEPVVLRYDPRR